MGRVTTTQKDSGMKKYGRKSFKEIYPGGIPKQTFRKMDFSKIESINISKYHCKDALNEKEFNRNGCFVEGCSYAIDAFMMGKFEITQEIYKTVVDWANSTYNTELNPEPSTFKQYKVLSDEISELRPVENINWFDTIYFCNNLTQMILGDEHVAYKIKNMVIGHGHVISAEVFWNRNAKGFRLPTEIEWEYAARDCDVGTMREYSGYKLDRDYGSISDIVHDEGLEKIAWFDSNSYVKPNIIIRALNKVARHIGLSEIVMYSRTHEVGVKKPNNHQLYDMCGNVHEWVWDEWKTDSEDTPFSLHKPFTPGSRVMRGGGWPNAPYDITVFNQWAMQPSYCSDLCPEQSDLSDVGFRVCCSV